MGAREPAAEPHAGDIVAPTKPHTPPPPPLFHPNIHPFKENGPVFEAALRPIVVFCVYL